LGNDILDSPILTATPREATNRIVRLRGGLHADSALLLSLVAVLVGKTAGPMGIELVVQKLQYRVVYSTNPSIVYSRNKIVLFITTCAGMALEAPNARTEICCRQWIHFR